MGGLGKEASQVQIQQARFIQVFEYWGEKLDLDEYIVCMI